METIVELIDHVINNIENQSILEAVAKEVHSLMKGRALFNL
jgi:glycine/serine hydroxymethyltransferase